VILKDPPGGPRAKLRWEVKDITRGSVPTVILSGEGDSIDGQTYSPGKYHVRFFCDANGNKMFDLYEGEPYVARSFSVVDCSETAKGDWDSIGWTASKCYKWGGGWEEVVAEDGCGNKVIIKCAGSVGSRHYELWYVPAGGIGSKVGQCVWADGRNDLGVLYSAPSGSTILGTRMTNYDPDSPRYWIFEYDGLTGALICKLFTGSGPPVVQSCPF